MKRDTGTKRGLEKDKLLWGIFLLCFVTAGVTGCSGISDVSASPTETVVQETVAPVIDHNEDETSNLGAWTRAMGGVLISLNEGNPYYFGGYEANETNREAAASILKSSWNITSTKTLKKQISRLLKTGSRQEYRQEAKEMNAMTAGERKKALKQLSGDLAIHYKNVEYNWNTWGKKGLLAWDMCRISHLAQWGYVAGYLDLKEAQSIMEPAVRKLQNNFTNWDDVVRNWLDGYGLSSSIPLESVEKTDCDSRWEIYQNLVEQQEEKGLLYDDSLFTEDIIPISR